MRKNTKQVLAEKIVNDTATELFFTIWECSEMERPLPEQPQMKTLLLCKWRAFSLKAAAAELVSKRVAKRAGKYTAALLETYGDIAAELLSALPWSELSESEKLEAAMTAGWFRETFPQTAAKNWRKMKNVFENGFS